MSKMKIIIGGILLIGFCVAALLLADWAMTSSTVSSGGDKIPAHEEERIRRELIKQGLPTSQKEAREFEYQKKYELDRQENDNGE